MTSLSSSSSPTDDGNAKTKNQQQLQDACGVRRHDTTTTTTARKNASASASACNGSATSTRRGLKDTRWSDIDKYRLYSFGTVMYSVLTVMLHPLTVAKIRRQILLTNGSTTTTTTTTNNTTTSSTIISSSSNTASGSPRTNATNNNYYYHNIRQYYRGLGVVITLAIPARILYISTLEYTREWVDTSARHVLSHPPPWLVTVLTFLSTSSTHSQSSGSSSSGSSSINRHQIMSQYYLPFVTPLSGGIAGGLAAVSSQLIVVPMDVISQKLIVMEDSMYNTTATTSTNSHKRERAWQIVVRNILQTDGWKGLYKGFGLSLLTSLPAGSIWWGTYAGIRNHLNTATYSSTCHNDDDFNDWESRSKSVEATIPIGQTVPHMAHQGLIQIISAFGAAVAAAVVTQPLDTLKTRLQVGGDGVVGTKSSTKMRNVKELVSMTGISGLYKGLIPRIVHMGVWGSILSAAYEVLKQVSRKDFEI